MVDHEPPGILYRKSGQRKFIFPEIVTGKDCRIRAGFYASHFAIRKALIVTDGQVRKCPWFNDIIRSLSDQGIPCVYYDGVVPNPRDTNVDEGLVVYQDNSCDGIIAIGGGSALDCAKGIGLMSANTGLIRDYEGLGKVKKPGPPLICIPTTAGSSADVSQFAVITDTRENRKMALVSKALVPDVALIDYMTTMTLGSDLTADTGMDALSHAIESIVSYAGHEFTDMFALKACDLIYHYLPLVIDNPHSPGFREKVMMGSMYAGLAFSNTGLGLVHAMSHALGGLIDLPHGFCNAVILPEVCAFNYNSARESFSTIGKAFGRDFSGDFGDDDLKECLYDFSARCGITLRKSELSVDRNLFQPLTDRAMADSCILTNPLKTTEEEVMKLYETIFR